MSKFKIRNRLMRHWSYIVCDKKYSYPFVLFVLALGLILSIIFKDYSQLNRVGTIVVAIGVWMSMRSTLREGINKNKDYSDTQPIIDGKMNITHFNKIGDAQLQVHGFILVI